MKVHEHLWKRRLLEGSGELPEASRDSGLQALWDPGSSPGRSRGGAMHFGELEDLHFNICLEAILEPVLGSPEEYLAHTLLVLSVGVWGESGGGAEGPTTISDKL